MTNYYGKCSQWQNELEAEIINKSNGLFDRDDFDGNNIAKEAEQYFNLGTQRMFNQTQWLTDSQVDEVKKYIKRQLYDYIMAVNYPEYADSNLTDCELELITKKYEMAKNELFNL